MGKTPRENRVPIMMSDEELTAVDDWRFKNRVATRSEAIRRLTASGLRLHNGAASFFRHTNASREDIGSLEADLNSNLSRLARLDDNGEFNRESLTKDEAIDIAIMCVEVARKITDKVFDDTELYDKYVELCLLENYHPKYSSFTPFTRVNEWLRAILRSVEKGE